MQKPENRLYKILCYPNMKFSEQFRRKWVGT